MAIWSYSFIQIFTEYLSTMGQALFSTLGISSEQGTEGSCSPGAYSLVAGNRKQVNPVISGGHACHKEIRGDWRGADEL